MLFSRSEELFKSQVCRDLIDLAVSDAWKWTMKGGDLPRNVGQYKLMEYFLFFSDLDQPRYYTHLDLPLEGNTSIPWFVGVYSSCGPVQYTLKAWCSSMSSNLFEPSFLSYCSQL